jgi:hypothetical protein
MKMAKNVETKTTLMIIYANIPRRSLKICAKDYPIGQCCLTVDVLDSGTPDIPRDSLIRLAPPWSSAPLHALKAAVRRGQQPSVDQDRRPHPLRTPDPGVGVRPNVPR